MASAWWRFHGESMFHTATDASKVCLVYLVERMKERGFILLDSQYVTDHLSTFNALQIHGRNIWRDSRMLSS